MDYVNKTVQGAANSNIKTICPKFGLPGTNDASIGISDEKPLSHSLRLFYGYLSLVTHPV